MSPLVLALWLGCTGSTAADSGSTTSDSGDTGPTTDTPVWWTPVVFLVEETWAATDGSELSAFEHADGSAQPPAITLTFLTEEWFREADDDELCRWSGETTVVGTDDRGDDTLWVGFDLSLAALESDCAGWDPDRWEGGEPTAALEAASWWTGFGPLQELENVLRVNYQDAGLDWNDWRDKLFAQSFALTLGGESEVTKTGQVLGYALDDGVLTSEALATADEVPEGALHGTGLFAYEVEKLPE